MKFLFFTPPVNYSYVRLGRCGGLSKGGEKWPPVKLMFAAATVRDGVDVKILDAESRMTARDFMDRVRLFRPDVVVFEPTPGSIIHEDKTISQIREFFPDVRSIALGGFATPFAREILLRFSNIDFVIDGEAELPLKDFVELGGRAPAKGMWYRSDGNPTFAGENRIVEDLDTLAFPAHDLIEGKIYSSPLVKRTPFTITESSRGCPHECIFCNAQFMGGKVPRFRSVGHLLEEMEFIRRCGFREVKFNDETFTLDKGRTLEFSEELLRRDIGLSWKFNTRADYLDGEILENVSRAGCHTIFIGVESASPDIRAYYRKNISLEQVEDVVRIARKWHIRTVLHFIFGAPGETWETVEASIRFACKANPDFVGFNVLTPYPGTRLFHDLKNRGLLLSDDPLLLDQSFTAVIRSEKLSPDDLEKAIGIANSSFYFRPAYILRRLAEMNPRDFGRNAGALARLLFK